MKLEQILELVRRRDIEKLAEILYGDSLDVVRKYDMFPVDVVRDAVEEIVKMIGVDADVFTDCPPYVDEDCRIAIVKDGRAFVSRLSQLDVDSLRRFLQS